MRLSNRGGFGQILLGVPVILMMLAVPVSLNGEARGGASCASTSGCGWDSQVLTAVVSSLSASPIYFRASGDINPDGNGGGFGSITVNASGPAHAVWGSWTVQNATGNSIANGTFSAGDCYPTVFIPWSGTGQASNGTLRVIVTGGVSAQDSIPCGEQGQSQDGLEVSSQYGSATCPYQPQ